MIQSTTAEDTTCISEIYNPCFLGSVITFEEQAVGVDR
jgi:L-amino acid N-acyltransferase YncA